MTKLVLAFCVFPAIVFGQLSILVVEGDLVIEHSGLTLTYYPLGEFKPLDWQVGTAYYPDGSSKNFDGIRYNLPEDRAEVNANGNILPLLPGVVTGISMGGSQINHVFINVPGETPVFMELLSPGAADLMIYRQVDTEEKPDIEGAVNTFRFEKEIKEVKYKEIIYIWHHAKIEKFKASKKHIGLIMIDHGNEVETFMKENHTRLKNPKDLVVLFNYYNQL